MSLLKIIFVSIAICFSEFSVAQKFLAIDKYGSADRRKFFINDFITIEKKNDPEIHNGKIMAINDTAIILNENDLIPISEITKITCDRRSRFPGFISTLFINAGIGVVLVYGVNSLFNRHDYFSAPIVLGGAGLICSGAAILKLKRQKYIMKDPFFLRIIDMGT
jgi:hypothetical protein